MSGPVTVSQLAAALQEQVDECFDDRCEMCARHEALIRLAHAKASSDGEGVGP